MATEEEVAAGLLDWLNSLETSDLISNVQQLNNGDAIWKALQIIDRLSFPGSLPENPSKLNTANNDSWIPKWNNLKHIYDALSIFLIEECGQRLPLFRSSSSHRGGPDLKAIAQHSSVSDTILLLRLCVVAASNCADRIEYLKRMQELEELTQKVLMETLQEAQTAEEGDDMVADDDDHDPLNAHADLTETYNESDRTLAVDASLASEEKLSKVIADNQRIAYEKRDLEKQVDDLYSRYERLQERFDKSQEELSEAGARLTAVLAGKEEGGQSKRAGSDNVIAALEARVLQAETENEELKKSNEIFKIKSDRMQKLQDDYDEIKIERDKLSRKANTAEKYRQKLEATQDMEKENSNLKTKVSELQTQIRQSDSSRAGASDLQRENDEYRRLLPSIEQERYELNEMKKRLEFDYHALNVRYHDTLEQTQRTRNEVEELQGRLRDYEDGITPTTPTKRAADHEFENLELEEADFAAAEARLTEALLQSNIKDSDHETDTKELNEDGISEDELRSIMAAMRAQMQAGTANERESGVKVQKKLIIMVEKARARHITLAEHVRKQSDLIKELQENGKPQSQNLETRPTEPIPEIELEELIQTNENLKREIKLITSAWYEQNQRMAASGAGGGAVALMRSKMVSGGGLEEPKSFLGKQRRMVDRVLLGTSASGK